MLKKKKKAVPLMAIQLSAELAGSIEALFFQE